MVAESIQEPEEGALPLPIFRDVVSEAVETLSKIYAPQSPRRRRHPLSLDNLIKADLPAIWGRGKYRAVHVDGAVLHSFREMYLRPTAVKVAKPRPGGKVSKVSLNITLLSYVFTGKVHACKKYSFKPPAFERLTNSLIMLASDPDHEGGFCFADMGYVFGMTRDYSVALAVKNVDLLCVNAFPTPELPKIIRAGIGWGIGRGRAQYGPLNMEVRYVVAPMKNEVVLEALGPPEEKGPIRKFFPTKKRTEVIGVWPVERVLDGKPDITVYELEEILELAREAVDRAIEGDGGGEA